jgi:hypothetical protein
MARLTPRRRLTRRRCSFSTRCGLRGPRRSCRSRPSAAPLAHRRFFRRWHPCPRHPCAALPWIARRRSLCVRDGVDPRRRLMPGARRQIRARRHHRGAARGGRGGHSRGARGHPRGARGRMRGARCRARGGSARTSDSRRLVPGPTRALLRSGVGCPCLLGPEPERLEVRARRHHRGPHAASDVSGPWRGRRAGRAARGRRNVSRRG